ncbi:MAG: hypothetical protein UT86_C0002G0015 [Candidatus Magasanikbacteria bacterium GW2011_GWC2_40_17]|uniref:Uncharacterized protein n=1 Tax=Candidatus Magasanikbacteria bacterium GW2011_GWA2_42_32 TaxID=1619039 RepID=A0A0G1A755_9BACT|nr:MAG: hypothetical protein UT86_C0002G0015 [Candidatus Magasanikbacteria bacterium GW2011_GWC2_40_17]KKS56850.1 MAG: hypothetical protein UV20_C0005G0015 [Candidatus Magasanikbacteria bacterium GW2011_GWA2_42_32]
MLLAHRRQGEATRGAGKAIHHDVVGVAFNHGETGAVVPPGSAGIGPAGIRENKDIQLAGEPGKGNPSRARVGSNKLVDRLGAGLVQGRAGIRGHERIAGRRIALDALTTIDLSCRRTGRQAVRGHTAVRIGAVDVAVGVVVQAVRADLRYLAVHRAGAVRIGAVDVAVGVVIHLVGAVRFHAVDLEVKAGRGTVVTIHDRVVDAYRNRGDGGRRVAHAGTGIRRAPVLQDEGVQVGGGRIDVDGLEGYLDARTGVEDEDAFGTGLRVPRLAGVVVEPVLAIRDTGHYFSAVHGTDGHVTGTAGIALVRLAVAVVVRVVASLVRGVEERITGVVAPGSGRAGLNAGVPSASTHAAGRALRQALVNRVVAVVVRVVADFHAGHSGHRVALRTRSIRLADVLALALALTHAFQTRLSQHVTPQLVRLPIAVVVQAIAEFRGSGVNGRALVVAVRAVVHEARRRRAGRSGDTHVTVVVTVRVAVKKRLHTLVRFGVTVVVQPVARFRSARVHIAPRVVAVRVIRDVALRHRTGHQPHGAVAVGITIRVFKKDGKDILVHLVVAVIIQAVAHFRGSGVNGRIHVVAIERVRGRVDETWRAPAP